MAQFNMAKNTTPIDRRNLLKASAGGLTLAALGTGAACSSSDETDSKSAREPTVDSKKKVKLPSPESGVQYPDSYTGPKAYHRKPFTDSKKTFTVVVPQDTSRVGDWNKNQFSKWLEKRTGLKVKYQAVNVTAADGSQDLSKVNAMLSQGGENLPDAFLGIQLSQDQVSLYGEKGTFLDLTKFIDVYAPMERQMMSEVDTIKQSMTALDGKIYQFASINQCYHCRTGQSRAWINRSYLDKIGAKSPETTEDFRDVLKELKTRNPSGKKDFVPLMSDGPEVTPVDVWFVNPFTYNPGEPWVRLKDGKVEFVANTDGWRQGMAFMRKLYDDGTLTKQIFSIKSADVSKLGDRGLIGCCVGLYWGSFLTLEYKKDALWHDYDPVMPLKGPSGKRRSSYDYYDSPDRMLLVTRNCEHPELLVQWADYQMDLEAIMRAYDTGGVEGKQWDWADKGDKGIDKRQAIWESHANNSEKVGRGWNQISLMYRTNDFRNGEAVDPDHPTFESDLYAVAKKYSKFKQPKEQQLPPLIFDENDTATRSDLETNIIDHVKQSMAKFATGQLDVNDDKDWKGYTDKLDKMRLDQYLELYQHAYDKRPK